jgi:putative hemolysin
VQSPPITSVPWIADEVKRHPLVISKLNTGDEFATGHEMTTADLPYLDFDLAAPPPVRFSYASQNDPLVKRMVIRTIEAATGQFKLRKAYSNWSLTPEKSETIFAAGLRLLGIKIETSGEWPSADLRHGPLLIIANHPFGVADGLAIGDIATRIRGDVKIMTHSLLCQPPEASKYLLPVDFSAGRSAKLRSAATRKAAVQWLDEGHCLVIFPAGGVATRPAPLKSRALDLPWHPFTSRLAAVARVRILPMYFHGENSTLFHVASHCWYPLRAALFFRETLRLAGRSIKVSFSKPIAGEALPHGAGKQAVLQILRTTTFALDERSPVEAAKDFYWPRKPKF